MHIDLQKSHRDDLQLILFTGLILAIMALSAYILFICLFVKFGIKTPGAATDGVAMVDGTPSN